MKSNSKYKASSGRNSKKTNLSQNSIENTQRKITQFFRAEVNSQGSSSTCEERPIEMSPYFTSGQSSSSEIKTLENRSRARRKITKTKETLNDDEVVVISDSDSEPEKTPIPFNDKTLNDKINLSTKDVISLDETDDVDVAFIDHKNDNPDDNPLVLLPERCKTPSPKMETDSSGEEFLSQLDIDEIIKSSQEKGERARSSSNTPISTPPKSQSQNSVGGTEPYRTPTKLPKQKINKFSPLRHLNKNKRSRSKSSNSPDSQSLSPSRRIRPSSSSPFRKELSKSPAVKKLEFFNSVPYYLKNFQSVIDSVVHSEHDLYLLNEDDWKIVDAFSSLSNNAKCLYVRLFQRKWEWKVASTIKYPQINDNLMPAFEELHQTGFLIEITDNQPNLENLLDLLNGDQIVTLAKQMRVGQSKKTKELCKKALINLTKNQQTLSGSSSNIIVKSALKLIGLTYQLERNVRSLFSRLFILYSPPQYWEDEQDQTSNQLMKILMAEKGQMIYPECAINKSVRIYPDRDSLISFYDAWMLHCDISAHLESKNWNDTIQIGKDALLKLQETLKDEKIQSNDVNLPSFLRVYTTGSVLTRLAWLGVEGYQKLKEYAEANKTIEFLLTQEMYLLQYRGRWHERLSINMKHLKKPINSQKLALEKALSDSLIQDPYKLSLSDRLGKLIEDANKPQRKKAKKKENTDEDPLLIFDSKIALFRLKHEIPTRSIEGEKLDYPTTGKSVFIGQRDSSGSSQASSVELFAVEFYKTLGYTYGLHAEGAIVISIFGLLFWDEIYDDSISDTFHTPYQAFPLDMNFQEFYKRREQQFLSKFKLLRNCLTIDDAFVIIDDNWEKHFNKLSIVNWSVFPSVERAKVLIKAMGIPVTTSICERLAMNFRHCRSGFPDLVVWNETKFLFVEVKGPKDHLSTKQMLWIDFLISIGAGAEVCHVVAVSNKRIRTK